MNAHDEGRRAFLITSAIGVGAVATSAMPQPAKAQVRTDDGLVASTSPKPAMGRTPRPSGGSEWRTFFSNEESYAVTAIAERIMPGAPGLPGATDANVINYIDLALSGAYADQQEFYRRGLAALDRYCQATFQDAFMNLAPAKQDEALMALDTGKATGFEWPTAQAFFNVLRTHTMEGMFSDPTYGGNRDFVGWSLVGFPGAQRIYTSDNLKSSAAYQGVIVGLQSVKTTSTGSK